MFSAGRSCVPCILWSPVTTTEGLEPPIRVQKVGPHVWRNRFFFFFFQKAALWVPCVNIGEPDNFNSGASHTLRLFVFKPIPAKRLSIAAWFSQTVANAADARILEHPCRFTRNPTNHYLQSLGSIKEVLCEVCRIIIPH